MKGSIQPGIEKGKVQVCPACGSGFVHADPKVPISPLFCPNHPNITPTRYRAKFGSICRHLASYKAAEMELVGLNYKRVEGDFDARDYQIKSKPLAFDRLAAEWLDIKAAEVKLTSWRSLASGTRKAIDAWGQTNIKNIQFAQIQDFLKGYPGAPKSRSNAFHALKQFWSWAHDRYEVPLLSKWPKLGYVEMAFRETVDIHTQEAIINDIKAHEPMRVWLCVKWLATYIAIRPGEMRSLTEGQVDRQRGLLIVPHPKEKRAKLIPMIEEDLEIVRALPLAFDPSMPFFRHENGKPFGHSQLYRAWGRACVRLGVQGVPLYPGTKHSTAMGYRALYTPEQIMSMTLHRTSPSFNRYFQTAGEDLRQLLEGRKTLANPDHALTTKNKASSGGQVVKFTKK